MELSRNLCTLMGMVGRATCDACSGPEALPRIRHGDVSLTYDLLLPIGLSDDVHPASLTLLSIAYKHLR